MNSIKKQVKSLRLTHNVDYEIFENLCLQNCNDLIHKDSILYDLLYINLHKLTEEALKNETS